MAINAVEREVLHLIGENVDSPDVFVDTSAGMEQIRDSVNDAIALMCMVTGGYRRTYHLPLVSGKPLYDLDWATDYFGYVVQATDRTRHYRLEQTDPLSLSCMDREYISTNGDPTHYYFIGYTTIGVYGVPSASGKVIELDCVCIPKEYSTGTDPLKVRINYSRACTYFAVSEFYASRGDARRAQDWNNQFIEVSGLAKLKPKSQDTMWRYGGKSELS